MPAKRTDFSARVWKNTVTAKPDKFTVMRKKLH